MEEIKENQESILADFSDWYIEYLNGSRKKTDPSEQAVLNEECEKTKVLFPEQAYREIVEGDNCVLCGDTTKPNEKSCYAFTDLGNALPESRDKKLTGISKGSVLPIAIPCCKHCKANYLAVKYIPMLFGILIVLVGLIILSVRVLREAVINWDIMPIAPTARPFALFLLFLVLGILTTQVLKKMLISILGTKTSFDIMSIDALRPLKILGWFTLTENAAESACFDKELPEYLKKKPNSEQ